MLILNSHWPTGQKQKKRSHKFKSDLAHSSSTHNPTIPIHDLPDDLSMSALWSVVLERTPSSPCISPAMTVGIAVITGVAEDSTRVIGSTIPTGSRVHQLIKQVYGPQRQHAVPVQSKELLCPLASSPLCLTICPAPLPLMTAFLLLLNCKSSLLAVPFVYKPNIALGVKNSYL